MRVLAGLGAYLAILLLLWASALAADETYRLVTPGITSQCGRTNRGGSTTWWTGAVAAARRSRS